MMIFVAIEIYIYIKSLRYIKKWLMKYNPNNSNSMLFFFSFIDYIQSYEQQPNPIT